MAELGASQAYLIEKSEAMGGDRTDDFVPFTNEEKDVFEQIRRMH